MRQILLPFDFQKQQVCSLKTLFKPLLSNQLHNSTKLSDDKLVYIFIMPQQNLRYQENTSLSLCRITPDKIKFLTPLTLSKASLVHAYVIKSQDDLHTVSTQCTGHLYSTMHVYIPTVTTQVACQVLHLLISLQGLSCLF